MNKFLITLSSPIAVRTSNGVKMVNTVEATMRQISARGDLSLYVSRYFDNNSETMFDVTPIVEVFVKISNVRSKQIIGRTA